MKCAHSMSQKDVLEIEKGGIPTAVKIGKVWEEVITAKAQGTGLGGSQPS